jgi:hypothetical protein
MPNRHELTPADILANVEYAKIRAERRARITELKRNRRVDVGPIVTFYFENYDTMWLQVQEMVFIEKGGPEQVPGELLAYNPLIPNGRELVATFMIEIPDAERRRQLLAMLGGIEEHVFISMGSQRIKAVAETDQDRTTTDGKASSVQFVHFPFDGALVEAFKKPGAEIVLGIAHPQYSHMTVLPEAVREALSKDFD